jgi:hypothetical protein
MKPKLRSEGTPINSEIYAESLAGTEGSAKAEAASQDGPTAAHRRQPKDAGVFVPEGPDDGSQPRKLSGLECAIQRPVP